MIQKSFNKKRAVMWIGLICVVLMSAVMGYDWLNKDHESEVGPADEKQEIRLKITKQEDHLSRPLERTVPSMAEKGLFQPGQGHPWDHRERGKPVHQDRLATIRPDDEPRRFGEPEGAARLLESKALDSDQGPLMGGSRLADHQTHGDEPDYSDAAPPEVTAIWFDPPQATPGANLSIYVQAADNLSGVKSVSGAAKSPSGSAVLPFSGDWSESEASFVGTLAIPEQAEMGKWYLTYLQVTDNVSNSKTYAANSALLTKAYFEVVGSDSDSVPPEVTAVNLNPLDVEGGDTVQVTVEAEDDKSGVERISGLFMSPSKHARLPFSCQNEDEPYLFHGYVTIPEDAESGQWTLEWLQARDGARNAITLNRENAPGIFDHASVHVRTVGSDSQPPTLDNLMTYPATLTYEETAQIVVYASDDTSGISSISGGLRSPSGKARLHFSCIYDHENDAYQAEVIIPVNAEIGLWRVGYIRMIDKARNEIDYVYQKNALVREAVFEIVAE